MVGFSVDSLVSLKNGQSNIFPAKMLSLTDAMLGLVGLVSV